MTKHKSILILTAMPEEMGAILQAFRLPGPSVKGEWRTHAFHGSRIHFLVTGIGRKNAEAAFRRFEKQMGSIGAIVLGGVCGALADRMRVGDCCMPSQVWTTTEELPAVTLSGVADVGLNDTGMVEYGDIGDIMVTVGRLADHSVKQSLLRQVPGSTAVDMEAYWIAAAAHSRAIPCLIIKNISDTSAFRFPPEKFIITHFKKTSWRARVRCFLRAPHNTLQLIRLQLNMRRAAGKNAVAIYSIIERALCVAR